MCGTEPLILKCLGVNAMYVGEKFKSIYRSTCELEMIDARPIFMSRLVLKVKCMQ